MSTTAVIYSGEARSFAQTFANQQWHLLRHLPDPEFFISVADDAQADDMPRMLRTRYPADRIHFEKVVQPTLPEPPPDPLFLGFKPSVPAQAILRQLWALQQAWAFAGEPLGLTVRIRPDIAFTRFELPNLRYSPSCLTPWWGRWGGVNDRFAFLCDFGVVPYFTTFCRIERLMDAGCPLHPETLIAASLRDAEITLHHTLAAEFVTVRMDGTTRPADITMIDVVEYARTKP